MTGPREQDWLRKIIEDADKRVKDWPDWKKRLLKEDDSDARAARFNDESKNGSGAVETRSRQAHG